MMKKFFLIFGIFCLTQSVFAFSSVFNVPESAEVRHKIFSTWISAPISDLSRKSADAIINVAGQVFCVSKEDLGGEVAVFVVPRQADMAFDKTGAGTWAVFRDKLTGEATKIVWRFQDDSDSFLQIRSEDQKLLADFIIKGAFAAKGVPVGFSLEAVEKMSFLDFYLATQNSLPWDYVTISADNYIASRKMISAIRKCLGAFDEGVCAKEFVKWIVDSTIFSFGGEKIDAALLLPPTVDCSEKKFTASFQDTGCYNCLDWTRNLATASVSFKARRHFSHSQAGIDVQSAYLFSHADDELAEVPAAYTKDVGFSIELLPAQLFIVSAKNPNYFFLAAVRSQTDDGFSFDDTLALFPYFDGDSCFHVAAFRAGKEIDFEQFCEHHSKSAVHLVGVKTQDRFAPAPFSAE